MSKDDEWKDCKIASSGHLNSLFQRRCLYQTHYCTPKKYLCLDVSDHTKGYSIFPRKG